MCSPCNYSRRRFPTPPWPMRSRRPHLGRRRHPHGQRHPAALRPEQPPRGPKASRLLTRATGQPISVQGIVVPVLHRQSPARRCVRDQPRQAHHIPAGPTHRARTRPSRTDLQRCPPQQHLTAHHLIPQLVTGDPIDPCSLTDDQSRRLAMCLADAGSSAANAPEHRLSWTSEAAVGIQRRLSSLEAQSLPKKRFDPVLDMP